MTASNKTAIYAGTFDPITNGHLDLIKRAANIFDGLILAIGTNIKKKTMFNMTERIEMATQVTRNIDNVNVVTFKGLLVEYANRIKIDVVIRGLRMCSDFEYEFQMALTNRKLRPEIETVFLMPKEDTSYISSSLVKEIWENDGSIKNFVPEYVYNIMEKRKH